MKKIVSILLVFSLVFALYVPALHGATTTSVAPVIHLTFDGNLNDSSGNGYNGLAPDANIAYEDSNLGKAAKIDAAMITLVGSKAVSFTSAFSFAAWVRMDADVVSGDIISRTITGSDSYFFDIYSGYGDTSIGVTTHLEAPGGEYGNNPTFSSETYLEPAQNKEKFMHVAVVYDGKNMKIYLDGKLDSNTAVDAYSSETGKFFGTGADFIVGGTGSSTFFHGWMDDLYVFDKTITFADVTALYNSGIKTGVNKMVVTINDPYMMVNGTKVEIDKGRGTSPIVNSQGRTILPIRAVIESMGGTIAWDGATQMATVSLNGKVIKLWINKDKAESNGVLKEIDPGKGVTPELINGRTMLPIRFILKELGLPDLKWDGNLRTITIQY